MAMAGLLALPPWPTAATRGSSFRESIEMYRIFCLVLVMVLANGHPHPAFSSPDRQAEDRRLPRLEDFLALEEFGLVRPSPDGRLLAVEIRRPRAGERFTASMDLFARSDLWIVDTETREAVRITDGSADGNWYWSPVWSPDGRRLALLAGSADGRVRIALWEHGTEGLRLLTEHSADLIANFGAFSPYPPHGRRAVAWLDDHRLLTVLLPKGSFNREIAITNARDIRGGQWRRTERGKTAATVWDSSAVPVCNVGGSLMLINTEKNSMTPLLSGAVRGVSVSPDGRYAALILATASHRPELERPVEYPLAWNAYTLDTHVSTSLVVIALTGEDTAHLIDGVDGLSALSRRRFPRWSEDSRHLAVPARSLEGQDRTFLVALDRFDVTSFDARSPLDAELLAELLANANNLEEAKAALSRRPHLQAVAQPGDATFYIGGLGEGEVVRLDGSRIAVLFHGQITVLGKDGSGRYKVPAPEGSLVYPLPGNAEPASSLLFDTGAALSRVELGPAEARTHRIPKPHPSARLAAFASDSGHLALLADRDDGSNLWIMDSAGDAGPPVLVRNTHLRGIAAPERRILKYRLPNGRLRKALMLLPPRYDEGRRYPAALYVYPGIVITDDQLSGSVLNRYGFHPLTLLATAGYIVLHPSIPVPRGEAPLEILSLVTDNVLPAADAIVDQGFADGSRLGIYGHSYGGYTTLALVTQVDRFQAAVASASFPDLISYHDAIRPDAEILSCGPSIARKAAELEAREGILRMRAPPLAALERYMRNSPYFRLGTMKTPLLLLHGELDAVPAEAAERVFVALDRVGIPVRFARYWGEGHDLRSPGNIRHAWSETVRWFDTFLRDMPPER